MSLTKAEREILASCRILMQQVAEIRCGPVSSRKVSVAFVMSIVTSRIGDYRMSLHNLQEGGERAIQADSASER